MLVAVRNQAVDNRTRIFPFGKGLFHEFLAFVGQAEIFSPAAVGKFSVVRSDVPQRFKAFQRAVQSRLLDGIQAARFAFDFA